MKSIQQKWNEANRNKVHAIQKRYRTNHRALVTQRTREWAKTSNGSRSCLNSAYKKRYRITLTEYEALLKKQNHKCAICSRPEGCDNRRLYVDHCHEIGTIRGLVCYRCNTGLACFGDKLETMKKAVAYLEAITKAEGNKKAPGH